jgi:limonene-1,2-epoxide hydrolase
MTDTSPESTSAPAPAAASDPLATGASDPGPTAASDPAAAAVTAFLDSLGRLNLDAALALLAEDVVYQNVSLPAARGRTEVGRQLRLLTRYLTGFEAVNHRVVSDGYTVLTERTDVVQVGGFRAEFWVCGTFEVREGRIVLWRDYFDWANVLAATARGAVRAVAGLVRARR